MPKNAPWEDTNPVQYRGCGPDREKQQVRYNPPWEGGTQYRWIAAPVLEVFSGPWVDTGRTRRTHDGRIQKEQEQEGNCGNFTYRWVDYSPPPPTPEPTARPTPRPTPTPTPIDKKPTFGSKTIGDLRYHKGNAVHESLPTASGGDGSLTYSISPAMDNGLEFNASTRTITDTPTNTARPALYTYTATDADGDTASLRLTVTVFDLSVLVKGPNANDNLYNLNGLRWSIPSHKEARIRFSISRTEKWQVKVDIPAITGLRMADTCKPSAPTVSTGWIRMEHQSFKLVRCKQGSDNPFNISIKVKTESETGAGSAFSIPNVTLPGAPHYADNNVTYYIRGTTFSRDSPDQTNFPGYSSFWDTVKYNPAFQGHQMRPDSLKFPVFI